MEKKLWARLKEARRQIDRMHGSGWHGEYRGGVAKNREDDRAAQSEGNRSS
jgi:hypothetical protein